MWASGFFSLSCFCVFEVKKAWNMNVRLNERAKVDRRENKITNPKFKVQKIFSWYCWNLIRRVYCSSIMIEIQSWQRERNLIWSNNLKTFLSLWFKYLLAPNNFFLSKNFFNKNFLFAYNIFFCCWKNPLLFIKYLKYPKPKTRDFSNMFAGTNFIFNQIGQRISKSSAKSHFVVLKFKKIKVNSHYKLLSFHVNSSSRSRNCHPQMGIFFLIFFLIQKIQISTFKGLSEQPKDLDSLSDGIILTEIMNIMYDSPAELILIF